MILGMPARRLASVPSLPTGLDFVRYEGDGSYPRTIAGPNMQNGGVIFIMPEGSVGFLVMSDGTNVFSSTTQNINSVVLSDISFISDGIRIESPNDLVANASGVFYRVLMISNDSEFCSVTSYVGNGENRTIPHGASFTPEAFISGRVSTGQATLYVDSGRSLNYAVNSIATTSGIWQNTAPDSTNVSVDTSASVNASGNDYILAVFGGDLIQSRQYTGNGSSTGPVIDFGWQPLVVINKTLTASSVPFYWYDQVTTPGFSGSESRITPGIGGVSTANRLALVANGIQIVSSNSDTNASGRQYLTLGFRRKP